MASERRKKATRRSDEFTTPEATTSTQVAPKPDPNKRQFQIVIVNTMATVVNASVFAEDGTTPTSVKLMPGEKSQPFNTERITPHTKRLRELGHVRLDTIQP